jgi:hypothetical protein
MLDARAFDHINADTDHTHLKLSSRSGQRDPPLALIRDNLP